METVNKWCNRERRERERGKGLREEVMEGERKEQEIKRHKYKKKERRS